MATSPAKKTPAKKAAPARKAAPVKKAPARKAPVKAVPKAAPAKKSSAKKAAPAKTAVPARKAPAKKAAPAKKSARPPAKKAAPQPAKKAVKKGPVVLDKFQEGQRKALLEERERLTRHSETLRAEADSLAADREAGDTQFDDESGEGDTLAVERERDLVLSAQALQLVTEIDHALEKLANGTYGVCEISGLAIPKERLKAIPWARERVEYKATGFIR
jgi:RNA polymerase-binding transcription factor DksA